MLSASLRNRDNYENEKKEKVVLIKKKLEVVNQ